jgi:Tfp pilus assembly PilM family ATPase
MRMNFFHKLKDFFSEHPIPHSAIQVTSSYLCGIHLSTKDRKLKNYFVLPISGGIIQPSFEKANIKNPSLLQKIIQEGVKKFDIYDHGMALLIPELSQRTFVFSFDALPATSKEREQLIRFRVKKQMPLLSADVRISFDMLQTKERKKVISSAARSAVVNDYEEFFGQLRLKIKDVGLPLMGLSHLLNWNEEKNFFLINIEKDSFGLLAITEAMPSLYRQKPLRVRLEKNFVSERIQNIVQEIENTAQFIRDKEKKEIASIWIRFGFLESEEDLLSILESRLDLPIKKVETLVNLDLSQQEKKILSPLIGQLL